MDLLGGVRRRRRRLLARASGRRVLEVGVGTGRNLGLYPAGVQIVGVDISPSMLDLARPHAHTIGVADVVLQPGDVHRLPLADDSFDTVVATCVFCSVDDPVAGLREVVTLSGQVPLLEHVRPRTRWLARLFDLIRRDLARDRRLPPPAEPLVGLVTATSGHPSAPHAPGGTPPR